MSQTVIKVENLSKLYRLGLVGTGTMAHDLNRWWKMSVLGKEDPYSKIGETNDRTHKGISEFVWALKDINFEVKQGEVLGIIGRNGAGKSTLLKILSKVTTPTTGNIKIKGRIASLLEVGTGFHPELTGRENVYMNGTIMGMKKQEIDAKFDEILDFAGVERFIDTPVKRYSSGMMVRLGFAVAAFLEPEILIVDEVLAVGDAEFQRKCLGKMQDVSAKEGRTVLFVTHNLTVVNNLCGNTIYLLNGENKLQGVTKEIIEYYYNDIRESKGTDEYLLSKCKRFGLKRPFWVNELGNCVTKYNFGANFILRFEIDILEPLSELVIGIALLNNEGSRLFTSHSKDDLNFNNSFEKKGHYIIETDVNLPLLSPGTYRIIFGIKDNNDETQIYSEDEIYLEIINYQKVMDGGKGVLWHTTKWRLIEKN